MTELEHKDSETAMDAGSANVAARACCAQGGLGAVDFNSDEDVFEVRVLKTACLCVYMHICLTNPNVH